MDKFNMTLAAYEYVLNVRCNVDRDGWVDSFAMDCDDAEMMGRDAYVYIENKIYERFIKVKQGIDESLFRKLKYNAFSEWYGKKDLYHIIRDTFIEWQEPIKRKNVCNAN